MRQLRFFFNKSLVGSNNHRIFAPSKHTSGTRTAGLQSSLFCAPTLKEIGITVPSLSVRKASEDTACMFLTARSTVSLLSKHTSMSKKEQEIQERCTFAMLVVAMIGGGLNEFVKDLDEASIKELARIWDKHCHVPVGVMFNRPEFDNLAMQARTYGQTPC